MYKKKTADKGGGGVKKLVHWEPFGVEYWYLKNFWGKMITF